MPEASFSGVDRTRMPCGREVVEVVEDEVDEVVVAGLGVVVAVEDVAGLVAGLVVDWDCAGWEEVAGLVAVDVFAGVETFGGGSSSAGGGIGCGSGSDDAAKQTQRVQRKSAAGRNTRQGAAKARKRWVNLPVGVRMGQGSGNTRTGFGSTKTGGRR